MWPYAVAPAVAAVLRLFVLHPTIGILGRSLRDLGFAWDYKLNGAQAMSLVIVAASWKQVSYNFLFFLAGLQAIQKPVIEAAAIDGAGPMRRFWSIIFPLLSPTTFFLLVVNLV
jgi:sn-glycerol 3-phosphate transport system permease protein